MPNESDINVADSPIDHVSVAAELLALKDQALAASACGDVDFYRGYLADDAIAVLPQGTVDKEGILRAASQGSFRALRIRDPQAMVLSGDAGLVTYLADYLADYPAPNGTRTVFVTTAYRRDRGTWKGVLYQQTPIAAPS